MGVGGGMVGAVAEYTSSAEVELIGERIPFVELFERSERLHNRRLGEDRSTALDIL